MAGPLDFETPSRNLVDSLLLVAHYVWFLFSTMLCSGTFCVVCMGRVVRDVELYYLSNGSNGVALTSLGAELRRDEVHNTSLYCAFLRFWVAFTLCSGALCWIWMSTVVLGVSCLSLQMVTLSLLKLHLLLRKCFTCPHTP